MSKETLSWLEFLSEAQKFLDISQQLGDGWILHEKDSNEPNTYLIYKQKLKCKPETDAETVTLINIEYHIVYSISYQVPTLYFQAHRSDGSLLGLEAIWRIFKPESTNSNDLYQMITQMDHPVLFRPFMAIHPCRTADVLAQFGKRSENRLITFVSLYGPYVGLRLENAYGNLERYK